MAAPLRRAPALVGPARLPCVGAAADPASLLEPPGGAADRNLRHTGALHPFGLAYEPLCPLLACMYEPVEDAA